MHAEKYDSGAETTRLLMNDYDAIADWLRTGERPIYSWCKDKNADDKFTVMR